MKKQKILLITARSDIGGGPKYTLDFAESLLQHSTVFIAAPNDPPYGSRFSKIAAKHLFIPHRSFSLASFFRLFYFVRKNKIEIIHSHGRGAGLYSRLLKLTGAKVIHSFHGIHREPTWMGKLKFWIDQILNPLTDAFVFVSESEKQEAERFGLNTKPSQIISPIILAPHLETKTKYSDPVQLGSISRITYQKGIDILFSNLVYFLKKYPYLTWRFHLAGGGDLNLSVPIELEDRVTLHGPIQNPFNFLTKLDIYIANSRWESFNITVIEALSCHLPVLLSNVRGHEYFIQSKVATGFNVEDPIDFSEKLFEMIKHRPESKNDWVQKFHTEMNTNALYPTLLREQM